MHSPETKRQGMNIEEETPKETDPKEDRKRKRQPVLFNLEKTIIETVDMNYEDDTADRGVGVEYDEDEPKRVQRPNSVFLGRMLNGFGRTNAREEGLNSSKAAELVRRETCSLPYWDA